MRSVQELFHLFAIQASDADAGKSGPPMPPDFITMIHNWGGGFWLTERLYDFKYQIYILIVIGIIYLLFSRAGRNASIRPGRLQALAELLIEAVYGIVEGILGPKEARRYFPFLGALFIFILFMNFLGLFPLMASPTANILVTGSLAICVFLYVQYTGLVRQGLKGYFFHLMGEPRDPVGWCLVPLFLPLHILEELIKPLSLACRLYGNVYGKEILLGVLLFLGVALGQAILPGSIFGIPLHFPAMFLAILLGAIQALVFTLLATVYISLVLPHDDHHGDEHHEPHGAEGSAH